MKEYLLILPVALLVAYSQVIVKWRVSLGEGIDAADFPRRLLHLLTDPLIVSAYAAALLGSFAWLYVVSKLPLVVAFPVFIGLTFSLVLLGGWTFLAETLTLSRTVAVLLILSGIVVGVVADAGS